ncbi:MAG: chromatin assembly factor-I (CAF-I) p90 subunit [Bathelium mastoideum]|nr:MAG: chromatin assembly factor-I (CAF-I) p90 subunit [Bathelium mastoideum]
MSVQAPASLTSPRKRPLPADDNATGIMTPQKPADYSASESSSTASSLTLMSSHANTPSIGHVGLRQTSEAPSTGTSVSGEVTGPTVTGNTAGATASPAKRRKLTAQEKQQRALEKEQKKIEKEVKDRERAEQKAKKEEEKRIKDEARRQKNEEKEAKNREKELEKQRKEEARSKEERVSLLLMMAFLRANSTKKQLRVSNFFTKSSTPKASLDTATTKDAPGENMIATGPRKENTEPVVQPLTPQKERLSDYRRAFLPFQPPSYTTVAPITKSGAPSAERARKLDELEALLGSEQSEAIDLDLPDLKTRFSTYESSMESVVNISVRDIIAQIEGTSSNPIDLTSGQEPSLLQNPVKLLETVSMKHIEFHDHVRHPYRGTYTKITSPQAFRKVARRPFTRLRQDTDYDYDSEVDWEEPGEGEDLDSEGEEDAESADGSDDMEGFLDDEGAADGARSKRKLISGDLEPLSTGLCWEDKDRKLHRPARDEHSADFREYRMCLLIDTTGPIDPLSTDYWAPALTTPALLDPFHSTMHPPRLPLASRPTNTLIPSSHPAGAAAPAKPPAPKRLLEGDDLALFKTFVQGASAPKRELLDQLREHFPRTAKAVLKDTLNECAARVGAREAEKRWVVI